MAWGHRNCKEACGVLRVVSAPVVGLGRARVAVPGGLLHVLEAETGVDRFTLARGFRTRFGTSPHRYLTGRRLERVKAEIVRGTPLAEAAAAAGFADQSHMTRHFKSRFGLTPGRYAALLRRGVKP
jgi:AraC-like DNA-binding protein